MPLVANDTQIAALLEAAGGLSASDITAAEIDLLGLGPFTAAAVCAQLLASVVLARGADDENGTCIIRSVVAPSTVSQICVRNTTEVVAFARLGDAVVRAGAVSDFLSALVGDWLREFQREYRAL